MSIRLGEQAQSIADGIKEPKKDGGYGLKKVTFVKGQAANPYSGKKYRQVDVEATLKQNAAQFKTEEQREDFRRRVENYGMDKSGSTTPHPRPAITHYQILKAWVQMKASCGFRFD